jgi:hypothetical protein
VRRLFYFVALLVGTTALSQTTPPVSDQSLTLEIIGNGHWKPNRPFGVRVYSTPDGTKATVKYLTFSSRTEAKQYLRTCLRSGVKVIYRQKKEDSIGQLVGERIIAVGRQSGKKEFALIRGVHLNYYFIGSASLAAAIQVEELIEEK